jgi:hypothetical protein
MEIMRWGYQPTRLQMYWGYTVYSRDILFHSLHSNKLVRKHNWFGMGELDLISDGRIRLGKDYR